LGSDELITFFPPVAEGEYRWVDQQVMALARHHVSSNTITPQFPLENLLTFWQTVQETAW
jgi:hypothetical protein